jgi:hypothetical protein
MQPSTTTYNEINPPSAAITLLLIPSTYALITWLFTLAIIPLAPEPINEISSIGRFVISYTLFCFALSIFVNFPFANKSLSDFKTPLFDNALLFTLIFTSSVGLFGLYLYLISISSYLGNLNDIIYIISSENILLMRKISGEVSTIGVHLSYFSWISINLGMFFIIRSRYSLPIKLTILAAVLLQILGNLLFLDRTRPMWIGIPLFVTYWYSRHHLSISLNKFILYLGIVPVIFFFLYTSLTGKYSQYGVIDNLFSYVTGAYGYIDTLLVEDNSKDMVPIRSGYWIAKILELLGFNFQIPDQILDFRYVPFLTNVGTFIEPIYSDGGLLFVLIFIPIIVVGLDKLALVMYRQSTYLGLFFWGNIVFCSLISFFVPKFNQMPIWLFLAIALFSNALSRRTR